MAFIYSDFTSLSARHNMAAEQQHSLVERLFVGCSSFNTITTFGTASLVFVFGIELETQLSHYETHCSKRFLL